MITQDLIADLSHSDPQRRLKATRILGMLDEVDALGALGQAFTKETQPEVKKTLAWAGRRLREIKDYNTLDQIWEYFEIWRELKITDAEYQRNAEYAARETERFNAEIESERRNWRIHSRQRMVRRSVSSLLNLGSSRKARPAAAVYVDNGIPLVKHRVLPVEPSDIDIRPHLQRLWAEPDPSRRMKKILTIRDLNNTDALDAFADLFVNDPVEAVQQAAQQAGKHIYWNTLYWGLEKSGAMAREIEVRAERMGLHISATNKGGDDEEQKTIQDIEALLKRGMEKRRKR